MSKNMYNKNNQKLVTTDHIVAYRLTVTHGILKQFKDKKYSLYTVSQKVPTFKL